MNGTHGNILAIQGIIENYKYINIIRLLVDILSYVGFTVNSSLY